MPKKQIGSCDFEHLMRNWRWPRDVELAVDTGYNPLQDYHGDLEELLLSNYWGRELVEWDNEEEEPDD